jgi:aryl-phospho-beta-D-glucosidase BglC (GH1 family)
MRFPVVVLLLSLALPATAQRTPSQMASLMGRGINLGNTLEPPTEGSWNNGPAREHYFDWYVEAGFKTVRIPVRWDNHTGTTTPYAVQASWMDRVEEVVDWGLERDLVVILNTHHDDWIKESYADAASRARFDSIWSQIAVRFADKPDRLLFEIINEPFGMARGDVDELNARVLGIIRKTNPTRIVIFSGNEWSGVNQLVAAAVPDDPYLMGYFHSYDPWGFAGEGNGTWGENERQGLRETVQKAAQWSDTHGIPVMLSEFGVVQWADRISRLRSFAAYVEESMAAGIPTQVWDDGGWFGLLNRTDGTWNEAVDWLLYASPNSPNQLRAAATDSTVTLFWALRSPNAGVRIDRAVGDGAFEPLFSLPAGSTSWVDTGLNGSQEYLYRVWSTDISGGQALSEAISVTTEPRPQSPFLGSAHMVPGRIEAEHFDLGGEGLAYHDTDASNVPGAFRAEEAVDVMALPDGGLQVTDIQIGEWMSYSISVASSGDYLLRLRIAAENAGARVNVRFSTGASVTMSVPVTGSSSSHAELEQPVTLPAGPGTMEVWSASTRRFHLDWVELSTVSSTAIEHLPADGLLALYPNPAETRIIVDITRPVSAPIAYRIVDVLGRVVLEGSMESNRTLLDLSHLAPGWYVINALLPGSSPLSRPFLLSSGR